jgi:surface antigen
MTCLFKRIFASVLILLIPVGVHAECYSDNSSKEIVGTLLGAAAGGLIGSQIGGGTGNKVAIGAGVLVGGLVGNRIGRSLDCKDLAYHSDTTQQTLETRVSGTTSKWQNPDTGHAGSITPTRTYVSVDGSPCRDFNQTIIVDGQQETVAGTACRTPDGRWQIQDG